MSGFEWNKIAGSIFLAALIGMVVGKVTDVLYKPNLTPEKRGYEVAGLPEGGEADTGATAEKKKFEIKIGQLMAAADAEAGKALMNKCSACHTFDKGGANRVGPNLWGIVNAAKGHQKDYSYSSAMAAKGGNWSYEDLAHFLHAPKDFVPGTKMGFAGFKKQEDLANAIAYLRTLSDSPAALPPVEKEEEKAADKEEGHEEKKEEKKD
jgi:cytochrome c